METNLVFDKEALVLFKEMYGDIIRLNENQKTQLKKSNRTSLTLEQVSEITERLVPTKAEKFVFFNKVSKILHSLTITLFLMNPDLWKMMGKKIRSSDRIYPMISVPWFYWDSEAVSRENPYGVVKHEITELELNIDRTRQELTISGKAGNFCGLIESDIVGYEANRRPVILPTIPEKTEIVPKYEYTRFRMRVELHNLSVELCATPNKKFDYTFSISPKIYYDSGIGIEMDGQNVTLKTGSISSGLRGDVTLLIGWYPEEKPEHALLAHIWLYVLASLLNDITHH